MLVLARRSLPSLTDNLWCDGTDAARVVRGCTSQTGCHGNGVVVATWCLGPFQLLVRRLGASDFRSSVFTVQFCLCSFVLTDRG